MNLIYRNDQKTIKTKLKLLVFRSQSLAVQVRYRQLIYKMSVVNLANIMSTVGWKQLQQPIYWHESTWRTYSLDSSSWCILLRSFDLMRFIWQKVLSTASLLNGRARTDNATTLKSCSTTVIATNRPKIRTRHSKLAQKLATRRNVKFPHQLSPKLAHFGGKTAQLATLSKTLWMGATRGVSAYLDPPPLVWRWR